MWRLDCGIGRFLPVLLLLLVSCQPAEEPPTAIPTQQPTEEPTVTPQYLLNFNDPQEATHWFIVNDSVMGGVSTAQGLIQDGTLTFAGNISLENNGGFSSIRRQFDQSLASFDGLRVRLRGDGRSYLFRMNDFTNGRNVSHEQPFATVAGEWVEVELPFAGFTPQFRGRPIDHPPLDVTRLTSLGVMLREKDEGAFRLEIDHIALYAQP